MEITKKYSYIIGNRISTIIIGYFIIFPLIKLYPYHNDLQEVLSGADDWSRYAKYAIEIESKGILLNSLQGLYSSPAGFMYNYFLSLCFYIFGYNTIPIYIIQNILIGVSFVLLYHGYREKMSPKSGLITLLVLFLVGIFDIGKYYPYRFLSENLAIFTISSFFYCLNRGIKNKNSSLITISSLLLGLSVLTRPNIFAFGIIIITIFFIRIIKRDQNYFGFYLFIFFFLVSSLLLGLRNYLVCSQIAILPQEGMTFISNIFNLNFI